MFSKILVALPFFLASTFGILAGQNPCVRDTSFHIVVIGSSTAAGAGASQSDSAWVNRYRNYLQSLNPGYQVTNRAQGGYNTYHLMPSGNNPPANRPSPDVNRNISYAISLSPDAIIANLPSNDVSSGYSVQEQMDNWDVIWNTAQTAGIPIWICTTQPKNYGGNPIPIQKQQDVRDSIIARYSPFVIDFWTGLSDSSNQLSATYDSGDGTHLNDQGHGLLFTRVRDTEIPNYLYQPPAYPDLSPRELIPVFAPICGDPMALYEVAYLNRGQATTQSASLSITVEHLPTASQTTSSASIPANFATCTEDTLLIPINTSMAGDYRVTIVSQATGDLNAANDTFIEIISSLGIPFVTTQADTGCGGGQLLLQATAGPQDSIRWYDAASGGNLIGSGPTYTTPPLSNSTAFYAEAVRGEFVYKNSLFTTANNNISWNGTMFDLYADSTLVIDSLSLKVTTTGVQTIRVYRRSGTHIGYETNSGAWTLQGDYPVNVPNTSDFVTIGTMGISLNAGDSLALYLQLLNSSSTLGYQSLGQPVTRSTSELRITTGSGASFNFGGNFYPRDWNGEIFYHFGSKPDGDCQSPRVAVLASVSNPSISLGNDTILNTASTLTLDPGPGFDHYQWSTGDTTQAIVLDGNALGTGIYTVVVQGEDSLGCMASDTIIVVFAPLVSGDAAMAGIKAWPNPSSGMLNVDLPEGEWRMQVLDLQGRSLWRGEFSGSGIEAVDLQGLPAGLYLLDFSGPGHFRSLHTISR